MFQEKFLYYPADKMYLHIQECDEGYDYTLYRKSEQPGDLAQLYDGGVIETDDDSTTIDAALSEVEEMFDLHDTGRVAMSQDDFEEEVEVE